MLGDSVVLNKDALSIAEIISFLLNLTLNAYSVGIIGASCLNGCYNTTLSCYY